MLFYIMANTTNVMIIRILGIIMLNTDMQMYESKDINNYLNETYG